MLACVVGEPLACLTAAAVYGQLHQARTGEGWPSSCTVVVGRWADSGQGVALRRTEGCLRLGAQAWRHDQPKLVLCLCMRGCTYTTSTHAHAHRSGPPNSSLPAIQMLVGLLRQGYSMVQVRSGALAPCLAKSWCSMMQSVSGPGFIITWPLRVGLHVHMVLHHTMQSTCLAALCRLQHMCRHHPRPARPAPSGLPKQSHHPASN